MNICQHDMEAIEENQYDDEYNEVWYRCSKCGFEESNLEVIEE